MKATANMTPCAPSVLLLVQSPQYHALFDITDGHGNRTALELVGPNGTLATVGMDGTISILTKDPCELVKVVYMIAYHVAGTTGHKPDSALPSIERLRVE